MDLRQLRYFVYVAELKSFTEASAQLHIAQPALSRQMRKLEQELGVELFHRSGRGLELTEPGMLLLQRTHSIIHQVEQAREDVRAQANEVRGVIRLGVPPAVGELLVPRVIGALEEGYPEIQIHIFEGFSGFLYERLLKQEINLALIHNPVQHRRIDIHEFVIEQMFLVGPSVAGGPIVPAQEVKSLANLPLILPSRPHSLRLLVEKTWSDHGIPFNLKIQVEGLNLIKALIADGHGYTVLTYSAVHREVSEGALSAHRLTDPDMSWTLALASLVDQRRSRIARIVSDTIYAQAHQLVETGIWRYSKDEAFHAP